MNTIGSSIKEKELGVFYQKYKERIDVITGNNTTLSFIITFLTIIGFLFTLSDLFVYHSLYSVLIVFLLINLGFLYLATNSLYTVILEPKVKYPFFRLFIASFLIFLISYKFYKIYIYQECSLKKIMCDSGKEVELQALKSGLTTSILTSGLYILFIFVLPYFNNKMLYLTRNYKSLNIIFQILNIFKYISNINDYFNIGLLFTFFGFISHLIVMMLIRRKLK